VPSLGDKSWKENDVLLYVIIGVVDLTEPVCASKVDTLSLLAALSEVAASVGSLGNGKPPSSRCCGEVVNVGSLADSESCLGVIRSFPVTAFSDVSP
jgi:hypothetical protein